MPAIEKLAIKENLRLFQDHITSSACGFGLPGPKVLHLELACEEALVNIMNYAYGDEQGAIHVDCSSSEEHVVVAITDSGKAYNPLKRPDPEIDTDMEHRPVGGLGVYFMKRFMDHVEYRRENGNNILTLKIRLEP